MIPSGVVNNVLGPPNVTPGEGPGLNGVDYCGKSLYIDLNELQNYRRGRDPGPAIRPQPIQPKEEETRRTAKSILLTEDVLSMSFSSLSRHSYYDLEPDLIQVRKLSKL